MRIAIRHGEKYYFANVTQTWAMNHDNGALFSCGLTVNDNGVFTERSLNWLRSRGRLREISQDEWNHSGCQSYCTRRGDAKCSW